MTRIIRTRKPLFDTDKANEILKSISQADDAIDAAVSTRAKALSELYDLMKRGRVTEFSGERAYATLYRPAGRASTIIDPQGFRRLVKDDKEFYSAIKVSVTEAKAVLPQKQLATISTTIPASVGEETVKVVKRG